MQLILHEKKNVRDAGVARLQFALSINTTTTCENVILKQQTLITMHTVQSTYTHDIHIHKMTHSLYKLKTVLV